MLVVFPDILLVKLLIMLLQLLCVIHVLLGRLVVVGVSLIYCNIRFRDHINGFLLLASTCLVLHHRRHVLVWRLARLKNCLAQGRIRCFVLQVSWKTRISTFVSTCWNVIRNVSRILMLW
jgi:hypothetical protein